MAHPKFLEKLLEAYGGCKLDKYTDYGGGVGRLQYSNLCPKPIVGRRRPSHFFSGQVIPL